MKELSESQQQAYRMRHEDKMTYQQIADTLGCSRGAAITHFNRAVEKIQNRDLSNDEGRSLIAQKKARKQGTDNQSVIDLMQDVRNEALCMIDKFVLSKESARGLATIVGTLTDKIQLLKGEPTSITKVEDIRKMDEVAQLLYDELERRGMAK